ncbi:hypothetical protein [Azohydromonas aeria]|uniref:hypothetical protein n=1 Tax=Azohydromonas aeria TaxID=2590212 RepID=UPI0012F99D66|nr:hypothetical protein [Azohydromonas aeria]
MRDIRAQRQTQARIEQRNAKLELQVCRRTAELQGILSSAASAIIGTDIAGRITSFDPARRAAAAYD